MKDEMHKTLYTDQTTNFINDFSCKDVNKKSIYFIFYNDGAAHWYLQPWSISFY